MIGRIGRRDADVEAPDRQEGFDAFELRLGDVMRGERATLGKSLLDVQRELKIKAAYIAAIENCDPTAFDTPGFIAGYVRSYGRYLGMDPDWAFETFCAESGFRPAHGMSAEASAAPRRNRSAAVPQTGMGHDIFAGSATPFIPMAQGMMSGIEPRAVGSILVLVALIGGLGWGAWSVLQEVQRVTFAPVDQAPEVVAELDPLAGGAAAEEGEAGTALPRIAEATSQPSAEALDRLYRPRALDAPVLVARDGPISTLSPSSVGALVPQVDGRPASPGATAVSSAEPLPDGLPGLTGPAGVASAEDVATAPVAGISNASSLTIVATGDTWVRVRDGDGAILMERTLASGDTWQVPADAGTPTLRTGQSGAVYFAMDGRVYGPAGPTGSVTSNLLLAPESLTQAFQPATLPDALTEELTVAGVIGAPAPAAPVPEEDAVTRAIAEATAETQQLPSITGVQVTEPVAQLTMVAVRPAWVRIRSAEGTVLFEKIMNAGETWSVPSTEDPATLRVGESGAIYFAMGGQVYGPAGPSGTVTSDLRLSAANVLDRFQVADPTADSDLASYVRYAEAPPPTE